MVHLDRNEGNGQASIVERCVLLLLPVHARVAHQFEQLAQEQLLVHVNHREDLDD